MTLLDLDLADRFATAAAECGVGEAAEIPGDEHRPSGRGDRAEVLLREMSEGRADSHRWATVRAANLIWMLGRPGEASAILDGLAAADESASDRAERAAVEPASSVSPLRNRPVKARAALGSGELSDFHAMMASGALVMALGAW